jgi:hypothetical protein
MLTLHRYTWDGVIHKVEHLQFTMGLRYLADEWEMLDIDFSAYEEADADPVFGPSDDRQAMGQHYCTA